MTTHRITAVSISNFRRIQHVELRPGEANLYVLGGRNAQGKSSALDAVAVALGGAKLAPAKPIRTGADKAEIAVDVGPYKVRRIFTRKRDDEGNDTGEVNSTLTVTSTDGARYGKGQGVLDALLSATSIDPLAFLRMDADKQAATLREVTGLDFSAIDAERKRLYDERTAIGRDVKRPEGAAASLPHHDDAPAEEVSAATLIAKRDALRERNAANKAARDQVPVAQAAARATSGKITEIEARIAELTAERDRLAGLLTKQEEFARAQGEAAARLVDEDTGPIDAQIAGLDVANKKVRDNADRAKAEREAAGARQKYAALTARIEGCDAAKAQQLAAVKMPIPGLAFDGDGVTLDGLPFSQASQAEQFRAAVAIAIAQSPALPWMPMRDGSLLDDASMELLERLAQEHGAQVWIERVGAGEECDVVIEDGVVAEDRTASAA